jgi:hypothetical protein
MKWNVRAFINNPGGAYDPAPLHEFDAETEGFIPMNGDYLRWDETGPTYKVVARHFDYAAGRCALEVEETEPRWRFG